MTLQLYLFRQLLATLAVFVGGITFVIFPAVAVSAISKLGGVNISAILTYLPLAGMDVLPYLLPMAFLLAITATYGRLAAENEWTAMQMSKRNPYKLLLPAFVIALACSAGTYHLLATVRPEWKYEQRVFSRQTLVNTFRDLNPGRTELQFGEFYLQAARRPAQNTFAEVLLYLPGEGDSEDRKIVADEVRIEIGDDDVRIDLLNAHFIQGSSEAFSQRNTLLIPLDSIFEQPHVAREKGKYFTVAQIRERLSDPVLSAELSEKLKAQYRYELQYRPAFSCSFLLFVLFGAPLGLRLRKGTRLGAMSASMGVAFVYYIASLRLGKELAKIGDSAAEMAVWSTNGVALIIGLILTWRSLRR